MLNIKINRSFCDFFIRREGYADFCMRNFRMSFEIIHASSNRCNSGFIVSAQQGCAVGKNDFLIEIFLNFREGFFFEINLLLRIQKYVLSFIYQDLRLYIDCRSIWRSVHVSDQPKSGAIFTARRGRKRAINYTALPDMCVLQPGRFQLCDQLLG